MANHSCDTGYNTRTCTVDGSSTTGVFDIEKQHFVNWRVGSNAANASTIAVSGEDTSSAKIIYLDPNSDYYFTVSAGTVGNVRVAMVITHTVIRESTYVQA